MVDSDTDANTISETVGNGTEVQITGLATDADATDTVSYELTNDYNGAFEIDATTGVVTVKDSSKLDYETDNAPTITIKATSTDGSSSDATFTINLTDENDNKPTATDFSVTLDNQDEAFFTFDGGQSASQDNVGDIEDDASGTPVDVKILEEPLFGNLYDVSGGGKVLIEAGDIIS
ncbi:cadherin repeat domain-containing protein, partial [Vibrio fortis]|uniref:cadherin repeat domain-containing protein n=1 Tax=Vibrio fortis TaxID=212667 RepID=UPI002F42533C